MKQITHRNNFFPPHNIRLKNKRRETKFCLPSVLKYYFMTFCIRIKIVVKGFNNLATHLQKYQHPNIQLSEYTYINI